MFAVHHIPSLLLALLVLAWPTTTFFVTADGPLGIPGTTKTSNGYDTEMGTDPICWSSIASPTPDGGIPFPNGVLVENFTLAEKVELLTSCPPGTWLEAFAPREFLGDKDEVGVDAGANEEQDEKSSLLQDVAQIGTTKSAFRPRTFAWYNYTVRGGINLQELNGTIIVSDSRKSMVAVSIVACDSVTAGFCSPFVHEQANVREARIAESYTPQQAAAAALLPERHTGDRHGGTHVHAPAVLLELDLQDGSNGQMFDFEVEVPMLINDPGTFFMIGTLQFFTGDSPDQPTFRYDVANALALQEHERFVTYQDPPDIMTTSSTVRIVSYVCVGIACAIILYLLTQTVLHYKSQVLQISQAPFLLVFLLSALMATASSVLFDSRSDLWCNLAELFVFIPLQIMFAVTLGRLWRIHAVVSPLLRNRLQRASSKKGFFDKMGFTTMCPSRQTNIRREVRSSAVVLIVILCTIPQVVLQALALALQPLYKSVDFNEDESVGRCTCDNNVEQKQSLHLYSLCTLFALVLVLLVMAHVARQLPSLLNESAVIYDSTVSSILLIILGTGILAVTDAPTTSPDVSYLIHVVLVLCITLNFSLRIMMPKLKMIWNGQTILVSKLVADHRQSLHSSKTSVDRSRVMCGVTGFNPSEEASAPFQMSGSGLNSSIDSLRLPPTMRLENSSSCVSDHNPQASSAGGLGDSPVTDGKQGSLSETAPLEETDGSDSTVKSSQDVWIKNTEEGDKDKVGSDHSRSADGGVSDQIHKDGKSKGPSVTFQGDDERHLSNMGGKKKRKPKILVREGEAPSRKLTVKMLDLQSELDHVIQQIMSGMAVEKKNWEQVRDCTIELDEVWSLVQFDWEADDAV